MSIEKETKLIEHLKDLGSVAIAFSGGVDSTYLLKVARIALGDKAVALTINSPYIPDWELDEAKELVEEIGTTHTIFEMGIDDSIRENPTDRCYRCKKILFTKMKEYSTSNNLGVLVDGTNADDTSDYRPGMRALKELGIKSPLLECGLTKQEIRDNSKRVGLPTFDKPAYACMLTRIPHDTEITEEMLKRIEKSEAFLHEQGIKAVRVRSHDNIARIEIARDQRERLFDVDLMDAISDKLQKYGFDFVTMDMAGYRIGSMNQEVS